MFLDADIPRCLPWRNFTGPAVVPVNALLIPHLALFPKAKLSTMQERIEGFAKGYLELEDADPRDTMIIVSISGRNAGVVDMALAAKEHKLEKQARVFRPEYKN